MSRWWIGVAFAATLAAQDTVDKSAKPAAQDKNASEPTTVEEGQLPPEEDKAEIPKQYSFNPLQSKKEVTVGLFYLKKGDYKAAVARFREATRWNDGNAEAWLRLGEAEERNANLAAARDALQKYLELAPTAKNAPEVRKKLEKLKS
jgi:tetratricopeptide (TPR) repeat protein